MVNDYCWKGYVADFKRTGKESWLRRMSSSYRKIAPFGETTPTDAAIKSWANEYDELQKVLSVLPESYNKLFLVFEYSLPRKMNGDDVVDPEHPIRADVLLISKERVAVLEFKRMDHTFPGMFRQARKYRRTIQRYHDASRGMSKSATIVCTTGSEIDEKRPQVKAVSPDNFAHNLRELFNDNPQKMTRDQAEAWLKSSYSDHKAKTQLV